MPLSLYRFTSNYASHTKSFAKDDEALSYASEYDDGENKTIVEKHFGSDWFGWDVAKQDWVYNPQASRARVPHCRPDGSMN